MDALRLAWGLGLALIFAQAMAWGLARCLSLALPWRIAAVGWCAPLALLVPLLAGGRLVAPTDAPILANLPDAPRVEQPDEAHGVFNDAILQLLPWEAEVRRGLAEGHLPLWSDLLDGGSSPWVNPQAAVLSPIAMLGRFLPLEHFLLGMLAAKILLAFEGCWLLARILGAGRTGAALGAGGFALGGPILAWAVFPLSSVVAWSPWLGLGAIRLVRRPSRRSVIAAALVLAALLLSGHPEIALAASAVAAGLGLIAWRRRAGVRRPLSAAALAASIGVSLAACQLLPFVLVAPRSLRASHALRPAGAAAAGEGATAGPAASVAAGQGGATMGPATPAATAGGDAKGWFPPGQVRLFLGMLNPWAFGRPFHEPFSGPGNWPIAAGGYLGLAALAGCAAALAARGRRRVLPLLGLALGLLLVAAGFLPCRRLLTALPLGGALAVDRFLPAAALPLAVVAALGFDVLLAPGRRAAAGIVLALAAAAASLGIRHDAALVVVWLLVVLGLLMRWQGRRPWRAWGLGIVVVAALLDLGSWGRDALPRGHRQLFYPRTALVEAVAAAGTGGGTGGGGPWRAVAGGFGVYPSLLPLYGIADVRADNPLALAQQLRPLGEIFDFRPEGRRYKSGFRHLDHPFLDFLNVRAVIVAGEAAVPRRFERVAGGPAWQVYRNLAALPRYFLPVGGEVRASDDALTGVRDLRDARRVVLIDEEVASWLPPERPWDPAAVRILEARRGRVRLRLPAAGEKLLATSLPFPAGWTAEGGGRPLRRVLVNTAYLGVVVPPGISTVDLTFVPPGFVAGTILSVLGALGALAIATLAAFRRPAAPRSRPRRPGHAWLPRAVPRQSPDAPPSMNSAAGPGQSSPARAPIARLAAPLRSDLAAGVAHWNDS